MSCLREAFSAHMHYRHGARAAYGTLQIFNVEGARPPEAHADGQNRARRSVFGTWNHLKLRRKRRDTESFSGDSEQDQRLFAPIASHAGDRPQVERSPRWICQKPSGSSRSKSLDRLLISASPSLVTTFVYLSSAWKYRTSSVAISFIAAPSDARIHLAAHASAFGKPGEQRCHVMSGTVLEARLEPYDHLRDPFRGGRLQQVVDRRLRRTPRRRIHRRGDEHRVAAPGKCAPNFEAGLHGHADVEEHRHPVADRSSRSALPVPLPASRGDEQARARLRAAWP